MLKGVLIVSLIIAFLFFLLIIGRQKGEHEGKILVEKLQCDKVQKEQKVDFSQLENLPKPVQRYFRHVLGDKSVIINKVIVTQEGGFRVKQDQKEYMKMEAKQYFCPLKKSFVWDAKIFIFPTFFIHIFDAFIDAKGVMKGKILSLFTLIDAQGKQELNEGSLQRYLAESVWFPTALLPSEGVRWNKVDENSAKATITKGNITVSLEFKFNEKGEIIEVFTPERYREVSGKYIQTPWRGFYSNYVLKNGYLFPLDAKVEWELEQGNYKYWQASVKNITYN